MLLNLSILGKNEVFLKTITYTEFCVTVNIKQINYVILFLNIPYHFKFDMIYHPNVNTIIYLITLQTK